MWACVGMYFVPAPEVLLNMKWHHNRFLVPSYLVALSLLVMVGCTSKEDPSEVLSVCGNHSCGELVMVTTDTSSDGFQYLDPVISPDGSRILFTADWWAIPTNRDPGDEPYVNYRQLVTIPVRQGIEPALNLEDQGAVLIRLKEFGLRIGGATETLVDIANDRKGDPLWMNDSTVVFTYSTRAGYRLFKADISTIDYAPVSPLFMEPTDGNASTLRFWQHQDPTLSPDGRWLVFTRAGCAIPDSFETCSGVALWALDMATAGGPDQGYDAVAFPITNEYSRIESPSWSPDGTSLVFSGGQDVGGGVGTGSELFTMDFDTTGFSSGSLVLDRNIDRLTYTSYSEGDPITGVFNTSPVYSHDGGTIYFVSTRRAPSITLHDRNIWQIPANGSLDPEVFFFSRSDDWEPSVMPDGSLLFSSMMGFPTEMLDRLELEAYQRIKQESIDQGLSLTEVEMRSQAADERDLLSFFEGVMSQLYIFRK